MARHSSNSSTDAVVITKQEAIYLDKVKEFTKIASTKKRFASYEEMLAFHKSKMTSFYKAAIEERWILGVDLKRIKDASVYGEHTLEQFVTDMEDDGFSVKLAYACIQFAEVFPPEDLAKAIVSKHVYWGVINKLLYVKNREARLMLMDKLDKGELKPSDMDLAVSQAKADNTVGTGVDMKIDEGAGKKPPEKADPDSRHNYCKASSRAVLAMNTAALNLNAAIEDIDNCHNLEEDSPKFDGFLQVLTEADESAKALRGVIDAFIKKAKHLLDLP
jgi:hypothetical protein